MATDRTDLLEELTRYARAQGWNDGQLAEALGVSSANLSMWRKRGEVSPEGVEKAGRRLGLVVTYSAGHPTVLQARESAPQRSYLIPRFDVRAAMGAGAINPDHPDVIQMIAVDLLQLRRRAHFNSAGNLSIITGVGSSMEPTFSDGDLLLMDTSVITVETDGVFCFVLNGELYVKTLQRAPDTSILMISDNKKYQSYTIKTSDELRICGRIILAWNARSI